MTFFNPRAAALLLSLSVALYSSAALRLIHAPGGGSAMPGEERARDTAELRAMMSAAAQRVDQFLSEVIAKRLQDPANDSLTKECLSVCSVGYKSATRAMKKAKESVAAGDFHTANMEVSDFTTDVESCEECFAEFHQFDDWARKVGGTILYKLVQHIEG